MSAEISSTVLANVDAVAVLSLRYIKTGEMFALGINFVFMYWVIFFVHMFSAPESKMTDSPFVATFCRKPESHTSKA